MDPTIEDELREHLKRLPTEQQRQVLDFARSLSCGVRQGVKGPLLKRFGGGIPKEELAIIAQAIEQGCEQVNWDEW